MVMMKMTPLGGFSLCRDVTIVYSKMRKDEADATVDATTSYCRIFNHNL